MGGGSLVLWTYVSSAVPYVQNAAKCSISSRDAGDFMVHCRIPSLMMSCEITAMLSDECRCVRWRCDPCDVECMLVCKYYSVS